jgi:predicted dehydrogenase
MRQILGTSSGAIVARMPRPTVEPGSVLIRVQYSFISAGTELAPLRASVVAPDAPAPEKVQAYLNASGTYLAAALRNPRSAVRFAARITKEKIRELASRSASVQSESEEPKKDEMADQGWNLGYSAAGEVVEVGTGVTDLVPGDRVACAGAGQANHADYVSVKRNLVVRIPSECSLQDAATTTVGSIALQGVRRAAPQLGDRVAVLGLGIIGQLTAQMLKANGCVVIGLDLNRSRVERAVQLGMSGGEADIETFKKLVRDSTGGWGVDRTLITAATKSDSLINLAMEITRPKGTVVIVGDVGLNVRRDIFYRKEIDLLMSTSYGPGRYDRNYEVDGRDYPLPYVRWTLNRNMQSYLELAARRQLKIGGIIDRILTIGEAPGFFRSATAQDPEPPIGVLISYPATAGNASTRISLGGYKPAPEGKIRYALVGVGAFGTSMLVPQMNKRSDRFFLRAVVSRDTTRGGNFARANAIEVLATDLDTVLKDPDCDLVVLATRHHEHAAMAARALKADKHVFVEKPLALSWQELDTVVRAYSDVNSSPLLMVGFNRRFSPALQTLREILASRRSPLMINYRINARYIPLDHWVHTRDGGGRNLGEACHMYDVFRFFSGSPVRRISATAIDPGSLPYNRNDNFFATIAYEDGSVGNLTYTALGPNDGLPKERIELFCDGEAYIVDDFKKLTRSSDNKTLWESAEVDKGHFEELSRFGDAIATGQSSPIPFEEIVETSGVALHVEDLLHDRRSEG